MAERPSELNENAEAANNESIALTGAGDLSAAEERDNSLQSRTDEDDSAAENYAEADDEEATDETGEIRSQIEDTRHQMSETIDAIQEKLSFSNISEQVKDEVSEKINDALTTAKKTVYDATIRRVGEVMGFINKGYNEISDTKLVSAARENPLAVTLIGLGIGMLLVGGYRAASSSSSRRRKTYNNDDEYADRRRSLSSGRGDQPSALASAKNKVTGAASSAYSTVSGAANSAYENVGSAASGAYKSVSGAASSAYGNVTNAASTAYGKVGEYGSQAREQYDYYIEENPLAVGAVALAVGAAIGLAIPSTSYEGEIFGEYRQQVFDKAQTAAGDLVDRVKSVASEAAQTVQETVKEEAKAQGLSGK